MKKIFRLITWPIIFLKKIINSIFNKEKKYKSLELEDLAKEFYETYGDKIMFKLELGTNGENLTIYSSNFKTTLEKAKKRQKDVIETEITERN